MIYARRTLAGHPGLLRAAAALAVAGLVSGACSSGATTTPGATTEPGATPAAEGKTYKVASIRWDPGDIFFNAVQYGSEKEAKKIEAETGDKIEFQAIGNNDAAKQVDAFQQMMDSGVNGILHTPWRGEAMIPLLQQANDKGIPVVVHNIAVADGLSAYVAIDAKTAGKNSADAIVKKLDEQHAGWQSQPGLIIALRCIVTGAFDIGRYSGFTEVFDPIAAANSELKIEVREVGCDGDKGRQAVDDILSRYGNDALLAVWSIDGTAAVGGVLPALDARGLLKTVDDPAYIPVTTVDGTGPEMEAILKGFMLHSSQQPAIAEGEMAMRVLYEYMKTGTVPKAGEALVPTDDTSYEGLKTVPITDGLKIYESGKGTYVWQPLDVVVTDVLTGPWYVLPVVNVPEDMAPDDARSWPIEYEAAGN